MWSFMCNVDRIELDITMRIGRLFLEEGNVPDMKSTVDNFLSADPEIHTIYTYVNGVMDVAYTIDGRKKWEAIYPQGRAGVRKRYLERRPRQPYIPETL